MVQSFCSDDPKFSESDSGGPLIWGYVPFAFSRMRAVSFAKINQLPDLSAEMQEFTENPKQESFEKAFDACMPYYFPSDTLEKGRVLLEQILFPFEPAVWWQRKVVDITYNAEWVPESIKTLIIGSEFDAITPFSLFDRDHRFNRENIKKVFIKGAGHFPWIEKPQEIINIFKDFEKSVCSVIKN